MRDYKAIPVPPKPLFTRTEKKRLVVEVCGLVAIFALVVITFSLLAMMYNTPAPSKIEGKEVTSCQASH